jgi:hypothetical protein
VIDAVAARFPDVGSYNDHALNALEAIGSGSPVYTRELKRLLGHSERSLRLRAAVALANRRITSPRLWSVLEEGARYSGKDRGRLEQEAAEELADLGEQGIERLLAIISEPSTQPLTRQALRWTLAEFPSTSPRVADFILAVAADPTDSEAQAWAIREFGSIEPREKRRSTVLERAFSTGSAEVRAAAVAQWWRASQIPENLVERVFADTAPEVRSMGFLLLRRLPKEDPRRFTITAAALQNEDERVQDEGLRFAGELGEAGAALLEEHAVRGRPLTLEFFAGVERLGAAGKMLVKSFESRAEGEPLEVQQRIFAALARGEMRAAVDREWLLARLESPSIVMRERAATMLFSLQEDPWSGGGLIAKILTETEVQKIVKWRFARARYLLVLNPAPPVIEEAWCPEGVGGANSASIRPSPITLPSIPWPPPPGYSRVLVPRELFTASERITLGDVYRRLVEAIETAGDGFEHGLFSGPGDGFSLVARMERIEIDGTPLPEPARWTKEGSPKLSLTALLADLFFEKPGYFRVIVFAVTSDLAPGESAAARVPRFESGAAGIPPELSRKPFDGKEVLALVYSFERQRDARIIPWKNGAPSAKQHLEKAGVWRGLAPNPPL